MTTDHAPPAEQSAPTSFVVWLDASDGSVPTHDGVRWPDGTATLHHRHFGYTTTHPDPETARQMVHGKQGRIVWPEPAAVLPPPVSRADVAGVTADELAHAIDNSTPYPIELDSALCRFMAERLLEMLTIVKRPEHAVWQSEEEPAPGPQPLPEDPTGLADEEASRG